MNIYAISMVYVSLKLVRPEHVTKSKSCPRNQFQQKISSAVECISGIARKTVVAGRRGLFVAALRRGGGRNARPMT